MGTTVLQSESPALQRALQLVRSGYSAIAVGGGNKGKTPLIKSWDEFMPQRKSGAAGRNPTEDEVRTWWQEHPDAKMAIVCGWKGLAVIDIDDLTLAEKLTAQFRNHAPLVRTPRGGVHIYIEEEEPSSSGPLIKGVADLKASGGYVLAPPSEGYAKISEVSKPLQVPNARGYATDILVGLGYKVPEKQDKQPAVVITNKIREGGRNTTLTSFAGSLKRNNNGISEQALLAALFAINDAQCDPPLPINEVTGIAKSIMRYGTPAEEWQPIVDFDEYHLPPFPIYSLPLVLQEWAIAEAENTQTPVDLPALTSLGVAATCVQRNVEILIKAGHVEPLSAYILELLGPGNRKSAVFGHAIEPIYAYEKALAEEMKEEVERSRNEYETMKKRVKHAQSEAAKAETESEYQEKVRIANDLAVELSKMHPLASPRFVVDDVTPEKIVSLMLEQNERIGLLSADTDAFAIIGGRYDKQGKPNMGIFLKAHIGDTHVIDRMSRQGGMLLRPALTMVLTVQPIVLQEMSRIPQFVERGLIARIWFSVPKSPVGHRRVKTAPVLPTITSEYHNLVSHLLRIKPDEDEYHRPRAHYLHLSPEAVEVFDQYASEIEPKLAPHGDYHTFANWASKLVGSVARLAGLLHVSDHHHRAPWDIPIPPETLYRAIEIGDYLAEHARAAHGLMKADPQVENAKYLLSWIAKMRLSSFTKRDLYRHVRGKLQKMDDLEVPLALLIKHCYLRERAAERKEGAGRNPSPILEVHPNFLKTYGHNGQNTDTSADSDHSGQQNEDALKNVEEVFGDDITGIARSEVTDSVPLITPQPEKQGELLPPAEPRRPYHT